VDGLPKLLAHLRKVSDRYEGQGGELYGIAGGIEDEYLRLGMLELISNNPGDTLSAEALKL
jgi:hypothetical protein